MDALQQMSSTWRIPAIELREQLRSLLLSIMPTYQKFYISYSSVVFSKKHMSQYLRYPPDVVDQIFRNIFVT